MIPKDEESHNEAMAFLDQVEVLKRQDRKEESLEVISI